MNLHQHNGRALTIDQLRIARVMLPAIERYSEESFCGRWHFGVEHELWDRLYPRPEDDYEKSVAYLYQVAGQERPDWGATDSQFTDGMRLLVEDYQVWVCRRNQDVTAIHTADWKVLHQQWVAEKLKRRGSLESVWAWIHEPIARRSDETPIVIPPMPKVIIK